MLSILPHTHAPNRKRQPAAMFAPILILTKNCDECQTNKQNKRTNERSQINQRKQKHSTCSARLTEACARERGSATEGSTGRAAVKNVIKEIQIKGVQRA